MQKTSKSEMLKKAIVGYPNEYFDFTGGGDLSNSEIQKFIKEGIDKCVDKILSNSLKETFSTISTGNTKVLVEAYLQDNGLLTIYSTVSKNYCQKSFCNVGC